MHNTKHVDKITEQGKSINFKSRILVSRIANHRCFPHHLNIKTITFLKGGKRKIGGIVWRSYINQKQREVQEDKSIMKTSAKIEKPRNITQVFVAVWEPLNQLLFSSQGKKGSRRKRKRKTFKGK